MAISKEENENNVKALRLSGLVCILFSCLESGHYSTSEIRLAAIQASNLYSERHYKFAAMEAAEYELIEKYYPDLNP